MMDKTTTALPKPNTKRNTGERKPITLHYVSRRDLIDGRTTFAICGEYMDHVDMGKTEQGKSGSYVVYPMCDMEHDRLMQDPKGWAEHHYYGDSGDPMREAIRAVSLTELEHADVTIPEAAMKAGLDPKELRDHIMAGVITLSEMAELSDAVGTTPLLFIRKVELSQDRRENLKSK